MKYNKKFQEILDRLEQIDDEECQSLQKEIQVLADIYQKKDSRLNKIIKLSDKQQQALLELNEELDSYKNNLELKVQEEIEKRKEQEDLLFEQSRLAQIAEMIDAVAHQWMQPLNIIWMNTELLNLEAKKNNGVTPQKVTEYKESNFTQVNHLLETLRNFRSFFKPTTKKSTFSLAKTIESVLNLVQDELIKHAIEVELHVENDFSLLGNENEFKHILLNFINNSKYAFLENEIVKRKIVFILSNDEKKLIYRDNAGGIKEELLENLFEMHTSSKGENGSGIGLYISQQIAQKHQGHIVARNYEDGAEFTFIYEGQTL
jgi:signal transduction histidine kinase